jgi:hypothetical protein
VADRGNGGNGSDAAAGTGAKGDGAAGGSGTGGNGDRGDDGTPGNLSTPGGAGGNGGVGGNGTGTTGVGGNGGNGGNGGTYAVSAATLSLVDATDATSTPAGVNGYTFTLAGAGGQVVYVFSGPKGDTGVTVVINAAPSSSAEVLILNHGNPEFQELVVFTDETLKSTLQNGWVLVVSSFRGTSGGTITLDVSGAQSGSKE